MVKYDDRAVGMDISASVSDGLNVRGHDATSGWEVDGTSVNTSVRGEGIAT